MAKYSKNQKTSQETTTEALQIARATQRPGQTKEQTKLIANGIQNGIEQYKKQHKAKLREMDKRKKKNQETIPQSDTRTGNESTQRMEVQKSGKLPWVLLTISWVLFGAYLILSSQ